METAPPSSDAKVAAAGAVSDGSPEPASDPVHAASQRAARVLQHVGGAPRVIAALLMLGLVWWAQDVIIPVVAAILISNALEPVVRRLERWGLPRTLGVLVLLGALVGGLGASAAGMRGEVVAFGNRLPVAAHRIAEAIRHQRSRTPGPMAKVQQAASEIEQAAASNAPAQPRDNVPSVRIEQPTVDWSGWLWQSSYGAVDFGVQLLAIVCLVYYLLAAGDRYRRRLVRIVGPSFADKKATVRILDEIERQIARFIWARLLICAAVAAGVWVGFRLLGLEEPGVWAVLSGLLFAVPIAGPAVVIAGAGVAGFLQFGTANMAVAAIAVTSLVAAVEGNVLTPLLMRRVGEMSALAIFVSLMFWGWLWGLWGLVLAVPLSAATKAVCERVRGLEGVADLLGS